MGQLADSPALGMDVRVEMPDAPSRDTSSDAECRAGEDADLSDHAASALDIIFIVDNSSSVVDIIPSVAQRLAVDLPAILEARAIDYRIILLSRYGPLDDAVGLSESPICIPAPLGSSDCSDPNAQPLANHPPRFFQYSMDVDSTVSFCLLRRAWDTPDEIPAGDRAWTPVAPQGWSAFLRPGVFKAFVIVTDDEVVCDFDGYHFDGDGAPRRSPPSSIAC